MRKQILQKLFPQYCTLCQVNSADEQHSLLCEECLLNHTKSEIKCIFCDTPAAFLCQYCHLKMPFIERIALPFRYEKSIKRLIHQLKFNFKPHLASLIAELLYEQESLFLEALPQSCVVIPMPTSRLRLAKRGYNPIALIAAKIAQFSQLNYEDGSLFKYAFTIPQSELSRKERLENLKGSFFIKRNPPSHVLLIDDVLTTGETFRKAAQTLHNHGTKSIYGLLIAQA